MRQQVEHQIGDLGEKLAGLREPAHVGGDFRVQPGEFAEGGHEVRVGQEAHIEDHVGIEGYAVLESKAETGNEQVRALLFAAVALQDVRAELVDVEGGGVDERIGHVANGVEELALFNDGAGHGLRLAERMRAAGLGVAADEDDILGVEKDDAGGQQLAHADEDFRKAIERGAFAHIDDDGGLGDLS